jgi:hypothetical protein
MIACNSSWTQQGGVEERPAASHVLTQGVFLDADASKPIYCTMRSGFWDPFTQGTGPLKIATKSGYFGALRWKPGWSVHTGVDLVEDPLGIPVYAAQAGTIIQQSTEDQSKKNGYGFEEVMSHSSDFYSLYAHLASPYTLPIGTQITSHATKIATAGNSGNVGESAEGNHLHFELADGPLLKQPVSGSGQVIHDNVIDPCGTNDTATFTVTIVGGVTVASATLDGKPLTSTGQNQFSSGNVTVGVPHSNTPKMLKHVLAFQTQAQSCGTYQVVLSSPANPYEREGAVFADATEDQPQLDDSDDNVNGESYSNGLIVFVNPGIHELTPPSPALKVSACSTPTPTPSFTPAASNIYIGDLAQTISVYAANPVGTVSPPPVATITGSNTDLGDIFAIAVDTGGKIYAANTFGSGGTVTVYAADPVGTLNEAPLGSIAGSNTMMLGPTGIVVDGSGDIVVADATILKFAGNPSGVVNEAPTAQIVPALGANKLASDSSGNLYTVINACTAGPGIVVYPPTFAPYSPTVLPTPLSPSGVICGSDTGITNQGDLALDASNRIYVANANGNDILVFPANPTGMVNEAPVATIGGSKTKISGPGSVAVDGSGKIYVLNSLNSGTIITVYPANPTGKLNEAPLGTIELQQSIGSDLGPQKIVVH